MARCCDLTGKRVLVGNNVSHANNKTKRRYLPNLQKVTLRSDQLQRKFVFCAAVSALRTVEHAGGLDAYLLKTTTAKLPEPARKVKALLLKTAKAA